MLGCEAISRIELPAVVACEAVPRLLVELPTVPGCEAVPETELSTVLGFEAVGRIEIPTALYDVQSLPSTKHVVRIYVISFMRRRDWPVLWPSVTSARCDN